MLSNLFESEMHDDKSKYKPSYECTTLKVSFQIGIFFFKINDKTSLNIETGFKVTNKYMYDIIFYKISY